MFNKIFFGKAGQVGETVTWIVATVAIIVILIISILASSLYFGGENKSVGVLEGDVSASVSFFSWLLTEDDSGEVIYDRIKRERDLNDSNGNLAKSIFEGFYGEDYFGVWIGMFVHSDNSYTPNEYFIRPSTFVGNDWTRRVVSPVKERILINEDKSVEMFLVP